jgi:ABC-type spermidine/putrescine transport system permease subunit II
MEVLLATISLLPAPIVASVSIWTPLASTLLWSCVIGLIAALLAIPVARAFHSPRHTGWLVSSMLLPSYMVSVALNAFRGPGTWIGEGIEHAIANGWTGLPVFLGKAIAAVGLALWVLPLAAALLAAQFRSLDPAILDVMRLEPMSVLQRLRQWCRLLGPGLIRAFFAVAILMTGSAVPLHVAQVETLAISVWKLMDQTAAAARGELWLATWPFVLISLLAGWVIWRTFASRRSEGQSIGTRLPVFKSWLIAGGFVWGLAAVVPVAVAFWSVDSSVALRAFWRVSATAVRDSGLIAAATGVLVAGIGLVCTWQGRTRVARGVVAILVGFGVFPGALVGLGLATVSRVTGTDDGWMSVVWVVVVHVLRFGWIGGVVGLVLARSEPLAQREHRALDGALDWGGWVRSCLAWQWSGILAAGVAASAMSFSEIEATIFVQPPELESLPRQMLGHLHFSRTSELGAASFYVGLITLVMAACTGALASRVAERLGSTRVFGVSESKPDEAESQP